MKIEPMKTLRTNSGWVYRPKLSARGKCFIIWIDGHVRVLVMTGVGELRLYTLSEASGAGWVYRKRAKTKPRRYTNAEHDEDVKTIFGLADSLGVSNLVGAITAAEIVDAIRSIARRECRKELEDAARSEAEHSGGSEISTGEETDEEADEGSS